MLAMLLSSMILYNSLGNIDENTLNTMSLITNFA